MRIKEVTVGIQRIINLGNYENVRYECTATADVEVGEQPADVYTNLANYCREQVSQEVERLQPKKKK